MKLIWAVDPYNTDSKSLIKSAFYVDKLAKDLNAKVEPAYILSPNTFYLPTDYFIPPTEKEFLVAAKNKLDTTLEKLDSNNFLPGRVLRDDSYTLRGTCNTFIEYAKDQNASFIICNTHARRGIKRFWLGSFAETLIMYSTLPVVTINPKTQSSLKINNVLFPTDLSDSSKRSLEDFIFYARKFGARLHILHVTQGFRQIAALANEGLSEVGYKFYYEEMKKIKRQSEKRIKLLVNSCKQKGVPTTWQIVETKAGVLDEILKIAQKKKANLIAMATTSGPIESVVTGGIARQVARYAESPVWISHQFTTRRKK